MVVLLSWSLHFDLCSIVLWWLTGLLKFTTPHSSQPSYSLLFPREVVLMFWHDMRL